MQDVELLKFQEQVNYAGFAWYGWYWHPRKFFFTFYRDVNGTSLIARFVVSSESFMKALCQQVNLRFPNSCHLENKVGVGWVIVRDVAWFPMT